MNTKPAWASLPPQDIEALLRQSLPTVQRHSVIVHLENDWVCSGVYAKCFEYEGILTAGHCANTFLAARRLALSVSESRHQLWVEPTSLEHVPIENGLTGNTPANEPDLSFVIIRDKKLSATIRECGFEFYDLNANREQVKKTFATVPDNIPWCVAGNPSEKVHVTIKRVEGQLEKMVQTNAAVIQGNLVDYSFEDGFDLIRLVVGSDFEGFPESYDGVSGGGIWYQRFVTKDGKSFVVEPILAGIACWQSERTLRHIYKVRGITGYGWVSIYGIVPSELSLKFRREFSKSPPS